MKGFTSSSSQVGDNRGAFQEDGCCQEGSEQGANFAVVIHPDLLNEISLSVAI